MVVDSQELTSFAPRIQKLISENSDRQFSVEQVEAALVTWLESVVESLVEDCIFHTVNGSPSFALGRSAFEDCLKEIYAQSRRKSPAPAP